MFGIGFSELFVIVVVAIIAVGPDRMPTFLRALGRGVREFRRTTRELRNSVGLDEIMRDELRDPLGVNDLRRGFERDFQNVVQLEDTASTPSSTTTTSSSVKHTLYLTEEEIHAEQPQEGVDVAYAAQITPGQERQEKQAQERGTP